VSEDVGFEDADEASVLPGKDAYHALDGALDRLETTLDILKDQPPDADNLLRRIRQLRFDLQFHRESDDKQVRLLDGTSRPRYFSARFAHRCLGLLQDKLFERVPTVVLTSATLSSAGNFQFIRERLGLDGRQTS
jgi:ATP-dependent DNA helicase DinG